MWKRTKHAVAGNFSGTPSWHGLALPLSVVAVYVSDRKSEAPPTLSIGTPEQAKWRGFLLIHYCATSDEVYADFYARVGISESTTRKVNVRPLRSFHLWPLL